MNRMTLPSTPLRRSAALSCLVASLVALSGCFGGGGDDPPPEPVVNVPASAADTSATFVAYLQALVDSDTAEPLGLDLIAAAPEGDNEDPIVLN